MRVDFGQETEPGDPILEIPWTDPSNPKRHYLDLKKHPEAIAELEESRRYPALDEFLRAVNSGESLFRSAKCDVWQTSDLAEDEQLEFGLPFKVGSYVDLLFDPPELNGQLESHQKLADGIEERVSKLRVHAQLEVFVRSCLFHPEERWGYYLTVFTHAYGETPQEAEIQWETAIRALAELLLGIDRGLLCGAGETAT